jgi:hypothetical protein
MIDWHVFRKHYFSYRYYKMPNERGMNGEEIGISKEVIVVYFKALS